MVGLDGTLTTTRAHVRCSVQDVFIEVDRESDHCRIVGRRRAFMDVNTGNIVNHSIRCKLCAQHVL